MKKLNNKGFTIVELVIVVAVIAILAAVLIPTISGLIKTAQTSADVTLVKNVNLILATERATEGKNVTMQDALDDALEGGYDITKLSPTNSDNLILWDQDSDNFVLYANEKYNNAGTDIDVDNIVPSRLWNISDTTEGSKHSVYYTGGATEVTVDGVGFDAGNSGVAVVNYTSSVANDVIINTNGGTLNVGTEGEVAKGTIYHNGTLVAANVYTESNSFHTYGKIASLNLQAGKAVVENGAYVGLTAAAAGTTVEEKGGLFYVADENSINADVLATLDNGTDRSYKIGSKAELIEFRKAWNSGALATDTFTLTADIDISGENWAPIGNWEFPFNGTFNGNNHTISGLTAVGTCENGIYSVGNNIGYGETFGLFGIVGNGDVAVNDLTLSNVNIDLINGKNVGALIGYAPSTKNFTEDGKGKTFAGDIWVGNTTVGTGSITLSNIEVSGAVSANAHGAGLVGKVYSSGKVTVTGCVNNAEITSGNFCAGIVGYISGSTDVEISNCTNNGVINSIASDKANYSYFAVLNTGNNSVKITFTGNTNNAECTKIASLDDQYTPGMLSLSSVGSVSQNSDGKNVIQNNVDNGCIHKDGNTKIKGYVIVPSGCTETIDVDGKYDLIKSNGTMNISNGTFGEFKTNSFNITGGTQETVTVYTNATSYISGGVIELLKVQDAAKVEINGGTVKTIEFTTTGQSPEVKIKTSLISGLVIKHGGGANYLYSKVDGDYTIIKVVANSANQTFDKDGWTLLDNSNGWDSYTFN